MALLRYKKLLNLLIRINILVIFFILPIFFALFLQTNNVFSLNKLAVFKILVLVLLFFSAITFVLSARRLYESWPVIKKLLIFIIPLAVSLIVSALMASDFKAGFYGNYNSLLGLSTYLYIFLFLFLLAFNLKDKSDWLKIILAMAFSSLIVCGYALLQAGGNDPLSWSESTRYRVTSTFGQPNELAAYLLFVLPVTAYLFLISKKIFARILAGLILVLQILTLIFTYSISAWLGMLAGVLAMIILISWNYLKLQAKNPRTTPKGLANPLGVVAFMSVIASAAKQSRFKMFGSKNFKIITAVAVFLLIIIFVFVNLSNQHLITNKIAAAINPESGSTSARLDFWQAGWQAFKERPFFGYGPDNQQEALLAFYQADWALHSDVNVKPLRAHNLFLDILLTQGLFGLIAWILFLYIFYRLLWQNIREQKEKCLNYAVFFSVTAYLVFLQFQYHHITTLVYFFTLFVFVAVIHKGQQGGNDDNKLCHSERKRSHARRQAGIPGLALKILAVSTAGFLVFTGINRNLQLIAADHYLLEMRKAWINNQYMFAFDLYDFIKQETPDYSYYDQEFVRIMHHWGRGFDNGLFYQLINQKFNNILPKLTDENYFNNLAKARIYYSLAQEDRQYYARAEANYQKIIQSSPNMPANYYELANMHRQAGNNEQAIENYQNALDNLPGRDNPNLNKKHKSLVENEMFINLAGIGDAYNNLEDYSRAKEYYGKALEIYPENVLIYNKVKELFED